VRARALREDAVSGRIDTLALVADAGAHQELPVDAERCRRFARRGGRRGRGRGRGRRSRGLRCFRSFGGRRGRSGRRGRRRWLGRGRRRGGRRGRPSATRARERSARHRGREQARQRTSPGRPGAHLPHASQHNRAAIAA
jgi:hypothetical protein